MDSKLKKMMADRGIKVEELSEVEESGAENSISGSDGGDRKPS